MNLFYIVMSWIVLRRHRQHPIHSRHLSNAPNALFAARDTRSFLTNVPTELSEQPSQAGNLPIHRASGKFSRRNKFFLFYPAFTARQFPKKTLQSVYKRSHGRLELESGVALEQPLHSQASLEISRSWLGSGALNALTPGRSRS